MHLENKMHRVLCFQVFVFNMTCFSCFAMSKTRYNMSPTGSGRSIRYFLNTKDKKNKNKRALQSFYKTHSPTFFMKKCVLHPRPKEQNCNVLQIYRLLQLIVLRQSCLVHCNWCIEHFVTYLCESHF